MGLAANQARVNVLTMRKSDLETRLVLLMNKTQILANEKAEEISKKSVAMTEYIAASADKDTKVEFSQTKEYMAYEQAMNELEAADLRLTQEQKLLETQHQAVVAEADQVQKTVDTNIKSSFRYFN